MRSNVQSLLLLGVGTFVGLLLHPYVVGTAHGQDSPIIQDPPKAAPPAAGTVASPAGLPADAVEYNIFLPPAYPKADKVVAKLDELGAKGWHLVATTTSNGGTSGFIFMRPRR
jgi:hypothetical protein